MDASAAQTGRITPAGQEDLAPDAHRRWWMFLVSGSVWAIFALIVFRFDIQSAGTIGAVVGIVCIVAGVEQFASLGVSSTGWRIVRVILGLLFVAVGVVALVYPERTFVEIAAIFAFFLAIKGFFDIFSSIMLRRYTDLWWTGLIVGTVEILLAFWAAGNFGREAVLLVVWVGAGALAHAVSDFVMAARLHGMGRAAAPG
jgi:uncharacterized membrane protein HdeD (DUF308 family)